VITELGKRLRASPKPEVKVHCEAILKVVTAAAGEEHTYVRFSGE
jgi:hypothetical protein